jgi:hypothetical protein
MRQIRAASLGIHAALVMLLAGPIAALPSPGNAQNTCKGKLVRPIEQDVKVEVFTTATEPSPSKELSLRNNLCAMDERNSRYLVNLPEGPFWIESWHLRTTGPQDRLQHTPERPKAVATPFVQEPQHGPASSSIAVSPNQPKQAPASEGNPRGLEDLFEGPKSPTAK